MVMKLYNSVTALLKNKHLNSPLKGHFKKSNSKPSKFLAEFDIVPGFEYKLGSIFHVGLFNLGDFVRVSGNSKGRGFTGVIKRHNFARQKKHMELVIRKELRVYWTGFRSVKSFSWNENGWSPW